MFVASVVVAIGMLVFAAIRSSLQESELSGQKTHEIASLKQSIADLQKTVNRQSQVIELLSNEPISTSDDEPAEVVDSSIAGGEQLWAVIEPFVEKHIEDPEVHMREESHQKMEEAMAKSRERRNEQLAEKLDLNPFQTEQLAKVREEVKQKRNELLMANGGIADPKIPQADLFRSQKQREMDAGKIVALYGCARVARWDCGG